MEVKLHLVKGNPKGKEVEVPDGVLKVGRAEDSDLIIASSRISRHHCEILNEAGKIILRDKGSGNGSFVNGTKVVGEQALKAGDELGLGPLTFVVVIDGVGLAGAAPAAEPAVKAKPAAPAAPQPKAAPSPAARPKAPPAGRVPVVPTKPGGKPTPTDVLSSLERLAGGPKKPAAGPPRPPAKPGSKKADDVIEISDEDLLEP